MLTELQRELTEMLRENPYLLVNPAKKTVSLATTSEMMDALGRRSLFIIDADGALEDFQKLANAQTEYTLTDMAKIAGINYSAAYHWMREGIITASIRPANGPGKGRGILFSFRDAYLAGLIGSLRRQGITLEMIRLVVDLFGENENDESN